jgi:hypothetical protein
MCETEPALRHYLGMKAFTLSLVLLILGFTAATGQTVSGSVVVEPSSKAEPNLEAGSPAIGSPAATADVEHPRVATRPPTPLVRK